MKLILIHFIILFSFSLHAFSLGDKETYEIKVDKELALGVQWKRYQFSDLFQTRQIVNVIEIDLKLAKVRPLRAEGCEKLSRIVEGNNVIAAINGTFFTEECSSLNYLKVDGKTSSKNIIRKAGSVALLIDKKGLASMKRIGKKEDPQGAFHGMGGFPQLVKNSKVSIVPIENIDFFNERNPRSAVGLIGSSKILFVTVDGRSSNSEGLSIFELAEFMESFGVSDAMNLDGGGSTTMWVENNGVVNSPSDFFGQREITNGLAVFE